MSTVSTEVGEMTKEGPREMPDSAIERKPLELPGDPDVGLPLRKTLRSRLDRQLRAVAGGERGVGLNDVTRRLGLN